MATRTCSRKFARQSIVYLERGLPKVLLSGLTLASVKLQTLPNASLGMSPKGRDLIFPNRFPPVPFGPGGGPHTLPLGFV